MALYKRGSIYWYEFVWNGQRIQRSTKTSNRKAATNIEAAARLRLAKDAAGINDTPVQIPTLGGFADQFREHIKVRSADKPETIRFYNSKLDRLLEYSALARARLDHIGDELIERYVSHRVEAGLAPASVNRELATLRRLLYLAKRWKLISSVPKIDMLDGERSRDFVLARDTERNYLEFAPEPLKDMALLILDTGLRIGEALNLLWSDVHLEPVGSARFCCLQVRSGKTRNAKRAIPLTSRVSSMLNDRLRIGPRVFNCCASTVQHQHQRLRESLGFGDEFVIHSLRHTMLTRLGESGADAFAIKRIAGHSTITVSERYVHPTPEHVERMFERFEAQGVPTILPTVSNVEPEPIASNAVQ